MSGKIRELTFLQAINEALRQQMQRDDTVFIMGEDIGKPWEGPFKATLGLEDLFGERRIRQTPISEAAFIGAAVGAALTGLRPIAELMFIDFMGVAFDQILSQMAKLRYMTGGKAKIPMVLRTTIGAGLSGAAQHSESCYSIFAHIPGLISVAPSTPYDAKGLLISSIKSDDPVVFLEHKVLYGEAKGNVPEELYEIPLGKAEVKREGRDVTVVAIARMVHKALEAAKELEKAGVSLEVIDLRTLFPLDEETILESVKKTGKLLIVDEDTPICSMASHIAALVADKGFNYLDAPIKRINAPHTHAPFAPVLERMFVPESEKIVKVVKDELLAK